MRQTTNFGKLKYMMLIAVLALMSVVTFSSCGGNDDDDSPTINDYYIQFGFNGGGMSSQDLEKLTAKFNASLQDSYSWSNISQDQAIYHFNKTVDEVRSAFANGWPSIISGTMNVVVTLKTKDGKTVKTEIVHVTRTGLA